MHLCGRSRHRLLLVLCKVLDRTLYTCLGFPVIQNLNMIAKCIVVEIKYFPLIVALSGTYSEGKGCKVWQGHIA